MFPPELLLTVFLIDIQLSRDLDEMSEKFSSSSEENMLLRGELANEHEVSRAEVDSLQEQCQKLLRQNSSLLKSMATMEHDLEKGELLHHLYLSHISKNYAYSVDYTVLNCLLLCLAQHCMI
jgi:predicted nuclease with TOPRIM domain